MSLQKLEYEKLFAPLNFQVEYLYVFNDWFLKDKYKDTLEYIEMMDCRFSLMRSLLISWDYRSIRNGKTIYRKMVFK